MRSELPRAGFRVQPTSLRVTGSVAAKGQHKAAEGQGRRRTDSLLDGTRRRLLGAHFSFGLGLRASGSILVGSQVLARILPREFVQRSPLDT